MAGIDYTIPGQFKGIQLESPMNAMAQAMQLRGLQDTLQLNALKAQEYQQQQQEKNALAQLMATPGLKYGSDEFFNQLATKAPSFYEKIATGLEKRQSAEAQQQLALSTKQQREQAIQDAARKSKEDRRGSALRYIAGAQDFKQAASLVERSVRNGDISREEADDMLAPLYASGQPDMSQFRANVLTGLLPAKEALTAGYDVEKAALDVDKARQDFAKAKFGFTTEQIDTRRKQFDQIYPAISISSEADVEARIRAQAEDPVLGPLIKQFGSVEQLIARDKNEFRNNAPGYKARLSGVPTADILKAAEDRERAAFNQDQLIRVLNKQPLISFDQWRATQRPAQAAPAPDVAAPDVAAAPRYAEVQGFGKNVLASDSASMASMAPAAAVDAKTVAMPTEAAVTTADGDKTLSAVPVVKDVYGVDFLDPTAQALYTLASNPEFKDSAPALRDMADKMQAEFVARGTEKRKEGQLTGTFENVVKSLKMVQELKKKPNLTEDEKELITTLEDQIKAAQTGFPPAPPRPPAPTEISKKEDELAALDEKIRTEKDPTELKKLKERRARLKADINADVYGRDRPPATNPVQDALISKAILEGRLDPAKVNSRNITVIAKTLEMNPDANLKELNIDAMSAAAASKTLSVQQAKILTAANEADSMIKIVRNTSTKLNLTQYPSLNAIRNAVDKGTGGKEIVALNTAINALINAYARAINPNGVATVRDKNHAEALINSNLATGQLGAALDVMAQEMRAAIASPAETSKQLREQRNQPVKNAPAPYTDSEKERRYQAWKAKQGGK